jgi:hypothetical protein
MSEDPQSQKLGKAVDALETARIRLLLAHIVLAIASSFAMWKVTDSPVPLRALTVRGGSLGMIIFSAWAWSPYLVSWISSRHILDDNPRAVLPFIASATICACIAVSLMRNAWGFRQAPAPVIVAVGLTMVLVPLAGICSVISPESGDSEPPK